MNKAIAWVVVLLVIVGGGLLLAKGWAKNELASGPIKIGVFGPFTGDGAAYGEPYRNMVAMAIEEINGKGGVDGRPITAVYEDDKCNGANATNAVTKLITVDKVQVLIGSMCSSAALAAVPVAEKAKVVILSPGASSPDLTGKSPYFFRNYPSDASQGKVLAELANKKGYKKIAFIQENKDYPLGIFKAFEGTFTKLGGTLVKEEFIPDATEFRSSLTKLKNQRPDALFIDTQTPAAGARILKQLGELGWKPQIFLSDATTGDAKTINDYKAQLEGAFAAEYGVDPTNPIFQRMLAAYKAKYGVDAPYQSYAQTEYDSVYLIAEGVKAVGYDGEKLAAWSRTINGWPGASGSTVIGADGDRVGGHVAKVIHGGKVEILK